MRQGLVKRRLAYSIFFPSWIAVLLGCGPVSQVPPTTGRQDMEAWLSAGDYQSWHCEPSPHMPSQGAPHPSLDRVCSNELASSAGSGEYPVGSASVVELYDSAGGTVVGHAVDLHVTPGSDPGSWYYYEMVPADSKLPHDPSGVVFAGLGNAGSAMALCSGCHAAAGPPSYSGHNYVFTQVK